MTGRWLGFRGLQALVVLAFAALAPAASAQPINPFADWIAVVVAADYRDHDGEPIKVFDNARQAVAKALVGVGFSSSHMAQFSVRPQLYEEMPLAVDPPEGLPRAFKRLTDAYKGGCFFYLTSHGNPDGVVFGRNMLSPAAVDLMLDQTCGERPTVVVISACFSGVFVPVLAGPNRMVVTAARPDRASFGCGAEETYTYFDGCVLESLPKASRLDVLAEQARACVARRETEMGMAPASEPQILIGTEIAKLLPQLTLVPRPPG
jgi:hypothetical protein